MEIKQQIFKKWQYKGVYLNGDVAYLIRQLLPKISLFISPEDPQKIAWVAKRIELENDLITEYYEHNPKP
jgi:hypothetical protein